MVNKPYRFSTAKDGDTAYNALCLVPRTDVSQAVAVNNAEVLHLQTRDAVYFPNDIIVRLLYRLSKSSTLVEDAINIGCSDAFFR